MKIDVKRIRFNGNESYKILHYKKCCNLLTECSSICLNTESDENTFEGDYSVKLIKTDDWSDPYEDDCLSSLVYTYYSIGYCPFCQEEIKIRIVEEVDMTKEYLELGKERDKKWKQCQNTDSKKNENKLRLEVRELDNKINDFYESDGFDTINLREDSKEFNGIN